MCSISHLRRASALVAGAIGVGQRVAVGAEELQVFQTMVGALAVDVMECPSNERCRDRVF